MSKFLLAFSALLIGIGIGMGLMFLGQPVDATFSEVVADFETTTSRPEQTSDGRIAIYLKPEEQDHISEEMLAFLNGVQQINAAITDGDRDTITAVAGDLSQGAATPMGQQVNAKLPPAFRQLGQGMRQEFSALSAEAGTAEMGDLHIALSDTMARCTACHGTFGVVEIED